MFAKLKREITLLLLFRLCVSYVDNRVNMHG